LIFVGLWDYSNNIKPSRTFPDNCLHSGLHITGTRGLSPWMARLPGGLLHTNVVGCTVFAAVSGSSAATLTTVGKMSIPELRKRDYPEQMVIGTLAGAATLGLMIPPSLTLIVYGVTINESITKLFMAGIVPGLILALMFMTYVGLYSKFSSRYAPAEEPRMTFGEKPLHRGRSTGPPSSRA
jgi:C4-dicarboxylate transporter DctM subunit